MFWFYCSFLEWFESPQEIQKTQNKSKNKKVEFKKQISKKNQKHSKKLKKTQRAGASEITAIQSRHIIQEGLSYTCILIHFYRFV